MNATHEQRARSASVGPAVITPRWEWRAFARSFAPLLNAHRVTLLERERPRSDVYLVSEFSRANIKIRRAHIEAKQLLDVSADGLERWTPVLDAEFPLTDGDVQSLSSMLRVPVPLGGTWTESRFLDVVADKSLRVRVEAVTKERARLVFDDCPGEHTILHMNGDRWETVALEHVDSSAVRSAIAKLGAVGLTNTSYPRALTLLLQHNQPFPITQREDI